MNKLFLNKMTELLVEEKKTILSKTYDLEIDSSGDETDEIQAKILAGINNELFARNKVKLNQIENALSKIEKQSYGLCEDCGDEISEKRLLANPYFTTCISCAEQREMDKRR